MILLFISCNLQGVRGEGTKQLRQDQTQDGGLAILVNSYWALWSGYGTTEDDRLNVRIGDHTNEEIHMAFNINPYENGADGSLRSFDVLVRVVDPDGVATAWSTLAPGNPGWVPLYSQAAAGPSVVDMMNGYVNGITLDPTKNGDYYIEFAFAGGSGAFYVDLFDVTVVDQSTSTAVDGRLWSKKWEVDAYSPVDGFYDWSASLFNYSIDSVVTEIVFNDFQPGYFTVLSNSTGTANTGDPFEDRKSGIGNLSFLEYPIFLNEPDESEFPSGVEGSIIGNISMTECAGGPGNWCVNINSNKSGIADVLIDVNQNGIYDAGIDVLTTTVVDSGENCVAWDGKDGAGNDITPGTPIDVIAEISYGYTHIPLYDVEGNPNGYDVNLVRPGTPRELEIYWDDSNVGGSTEMDGCTPDLPVGSGATCHSWAFNAAGFGDSNTINTWWNSTSDFDQITYTVVTNCAPALTDDTFKINEGESISGSDLLANDSDPNGDLLTINTTPVSGPSSGSLTIYSNGTFDFTPASGVFTGEATFEYEVCDDGSPVFCETAEVTITVNDFPESANNSVATDEDINYGFSSTDFAFTDGDASDVLASIRITNLPGEGILFVDANADGLYTSGEEVAVNDDVLAADIDDLMFAPDANENGSPYTQFGFLVSDGFSYSVSSYTMTITVNPINDGAPVAGDDSNSTNEDITLNVNAASGVLNNDTDVDGDVLTVTQFQIGFSIYTAGQTANLVEGDLTINADGSYTFVPVGNYFGSVPTATYTVTDGTTTDTGDLDITVVAVNDAPVASNDAQGTDEETTLSTNVPAATDVDGTVVSYALIADVAKGDLTFNGDGTYSFDPNGEFEALATGATEDVTFTYTATDNDGTVSGTQTVTITVTGTNDAPVASNDAQGTDEETTLSTSVPAATDVDGTVVSYALVDDTTKGNLTFNGDGTYSFDPNGEFEALAAGATEDVTFTYTATDNDGTVSGTQTVTITVTGTNDAPVASNDAQGTDEETTLSTSVPAATDVDGTVVSYALIADVAKGDLTFNGDGTYSFDPNGEFEALAAGATEDVTFTYTATDNDGTVSGTQTVTITVTGTNDAPVASNDAQGTDEETTLSTSVPAATDVDGTVVSYALVDDTTKGNLTFNGDGTYSFDPNGEFEALAAGATEDVTFTYTATDNDGVTSSTQTVTITVTGTNDAPVVAGEMTTIQEGEVLTVDVLANDTDAEGDVLIVSSVTTDQGTTAVDADGDVVVTPPVDYVGDITVTYVVSDGKGGTATGVLVVTAMENRSIEITMEEVCINDVPYVNYQVTAVGFDSEGLTAQIEWIKADGSVAQLLTGQSLSGQLLWPGAEVDAEGNGTAWPGWDFVGGQWIRVEDGLRDGMSVKVSVNPESEMSVSYPPATPQCEANPNNRPVAIADSYTYNEGSTNNETAATGVLSNDTDADSNTLIATLESDVTNGTLTFNTDGSFLYVHDGSETSTDSFTYVVNDGREASEVVTVDLTIIPQNDRPVVEDFSASVESLEGVTIDLSTLVSDIDDTSFTYQIISDTSSGYSSLTGSSLSYSSPVGFSGEVSLIYEVCDASGACATGEIVFTIMKQDTDNDGISDEEEGTEDVDGDTIPNYLDEDSDADGILDRNEGVEDADNDGIPNYLDLDSDGDGISDEIEGESDVDGDGVPNYLDLDSDGDNRPDSEEGPDGDSAEVLNNVISKTSPYPYNRLQIRNIDSYPNNHVQVFNRWGNKVWETKGYNNEDRAFLGDGNRLGSSNLPEGTYFYVIDLGEGKSLLKGFVQVL
ncbi:hypothetical protein BFP72_13770 [Reichenbachiella sp. 5M10]|nr:hypothetical protein BFP72_13770 [Reichenbachiella sp. 5M10]